MTTCLGPRVCGVLGLFFAIWLFLGRVGHYIAGIMAYIGLVDSFEAVNLTLELGSAVRSTGRAVR